jgi:hypothetical protein
MAMPVAIPGVSRYNVRDEQHGQHQHHAGSLLPASYCVIRVAHSHQLSYHPRPCPADQTISSQPDISKRDAKERAVCPLFDGHSSLQLALWTWPWLSAEILPS